MIVPGSANPLLMAQSGDPLDELGKIERSVRLRAAASPSLSRTFGTPTNGKIYTLFGWMRRGAINTGTVGILGVANAAAPRGFLALDADNLWFLDQPSGVNASNRTIRVFRDYGAFIPFMLAVDTTQATPANRVRMYIGMDESAQSSPTYPTQNTTPIIGSAIVHYLGFAAGSNYFDGLFASLGFVDGQQLSPGAAFIVHPRTGQVRPKSKAAIRAAVATGGGARNGWGANGFFLPFDDVTSITTLGYDRSQSDTDTTGNNWTATNIFLPDDSRFDTPTTNYATFNPLIPQVAGSSILDGGLVFNCALTGSEAFELLTQPVPSSGSWQVEIQVSSASTSLNTSGCEIGIVSGQSSTTNNNSRLSQFTSSTVYRADGQKGIDGVFSAYGASWGAGDKITMLIDRASGQITFKKNGVSQGVITLDAQDAMIGACLRASSGSAAILLVPELEKMSYPFASGKALCAKNLPVNPGGPMKSSNAFVAVTDTGANIASKLSAARAGWSGYIDIIKRRDAAEGWRWIFSDDPGFFMDMGATATARTAVPSYTGTSYVAYSIKVSANNGVATGRLTHANGVADTVTDGLGNARKMILLKNEASGTCYVYHPDLTAGKLIYLDTTAAETTDATLSSVTAYGFTVAAALASGTYRWIALAEVDGFLKLYKYSGNASADGPFLNLGEACFFDMWKLISATQDWVAMDGVREPGNVKTKFLLPNLQNGESSDAYTAVDLNSNGKKVRGVPTITAGNNINTWAYAGIAIADFPFRYANAR